MKRHYIPPPPPPRHPLKVLKHGATTWSEDGAHREPMRLPVGEETANSGDDSARFSTRKQRRDCDCCDWQRLVAPTNETHNSNRAWVPLLKKLVPATTSSSPPRRAWVGVCSLTRACRHEAQGEHDAREGLEGGHGKGNFLQQENSRDTGKLGFFLLVFLIPHPFGSPNSEITLVPVPVPAPVLGPAVINSVCFFDAGRKRQNGEGLGLGRAGTPAGVGVGVDTAVQRRAIPSIHDSRQATLCA